MAALQEEFSIGNKESFKAFTLLAGGIVRQGETCGAIIGALAALGMVKGRERIQDTQAYVDAIPPALEVYNKFKKELKTQFNQKQDFEHTTCRYIQERLYGRGFAMTDPKERDAFNAAGGHSDTGCPKVCAIAAEIVAEKIIDLI